MTNDPPHLPRLRKVESPGTHVHWRRTDDGRYLAEFWQSATGRGRGGKWHIRVTDTHTNLCLQSMTDTALRQDATNESMAYRLMQRLMEGKGRPAS
jgi:hypothetical protein